eukprot:15238245-Alexandrium_andersonii.AAC.1
MATCQRGVARSATTSASSELQPPGALNARPRPRVNQRAAASRLPSAKCRVATRRPTALGPR